MCSRFYLDSDAYCLVICELANYPTCAWKTRWVWLTVVGKEWINSQHLPVEWIIHCIKAWHWRAGICFTFLYWKPKHPHTVGVMKHIFLAMRETSKAKCRKSPAQRQTAPVPVLYTFVHTFVLSITRFKTARYPLALFEHLCSLKKNMYALLPAVASPY